MRQGTELKTFTGLFIAMFVLGLGVTAVLIWAIIKLVLWVTSGGLS